MSRTADPPLSDYKTTQTDSQPRYRSLREAAPDYPKLLSFAVFNTINFQIALATPLVLMARHWGASSSYIGALAALVPLLTTVQLYMAPRAEYIGFRRVMLMGWSARNVMIGVTALLPWMAAYGLVAKEALLPALFIMMFGFNALRGMATASWMPWITTLVDPAWRGRYVSAEQLMVNLSSVLTFIFCGWALGDKPTDHRFGCLYIIAFIAGWVSLYFLKNVSSPPPKPGKPVIEPLRVWVKRVWEDRPFRRLIRMNVVMGVAYAAWATFTTIFMRDLLHMPERLILYMMAGVTLGGVVSSWGWGILADRFGSRPVLSLSTRIIVVNLMCWFLIALNLIHADLIVISGLVVFMGMGWCGFAVANFRYSLNRAPKEYPVLGLTLFSVMMNLSYAAAPILWGGFLDSVNRLDLRVEGVWINPFVFFYGGSLVLLIATKILIRRLPDRRASATHVVLYHMLTDYPMRPLNAIYRGLVMRVERANGANGKH